MIIAIDGPAGAGKSTVARAVARSLGFTYLDTGAMYRCAALAAPLPAAELSIQLGERVILNGRDVTQEIRTAEVSAAASRVAADPEVRAALVDKQRQLLASGDWVAEGRDIGTVVAPAAELKVYLDASTEERAARRAAEIGADYEQTLAEQRERDTRDSSREHSPLRAAPGALVIDTTGMGLEQVVAKIVAAVHA